MTKQWHVRENIKLLTGVLSCHFSVFQLSSCMLITEDDLWCLWIYGSQDFLYVYERDREQITTKHGFELLQSKTNWKKRDYSIHILHLDFMLLLFIYDV